MSDKNKATSEIETVATKARRGFLKKASIGAPIVIASSTKPAWGAACMSGMMSGNVSNHEHECELSGGLSHGHWRNHYIGRMNPHWTSGHKPNQWWREQNIPLLKEPLRLKFKHFYVQLGDGSFIFSNYKINDRIETNGPKLLQLLKDGDEFDREIATAFINASVSSLGYPYSIADVQEIYDLVKIGDADRSDVAGMLEGIHD